MRRANLSCSCGASVIFEDSSYTLIEKGGKIDQKGRKYGSNNDPDFPQKLCIK